MFTSTSCTGPSENEHRLLNTTGRNMNTFGMGDGASANYYKQQAENLGKQLRNAQMAQVYALHPQMMPYVLQQQMLTQMVDPRMALIHNMWLTQMNQASAAWRGPLDLPMGYLRPGIVPQFPSATFYDRFGKHIEQEAKTHRPYRSCYQFAYNTNTVDSEVVSDVQPIRGFGLDTNPPPPSPGFIITRGRGRRVRRMPPDAPLDPMRAMQYGMQMPYNPYMYYPYVQAPMYASAAPRQRLRGGYSMLYQGHEYTVRPDGLIDRNPRRILDMMERGVPFEDRQMLQQLRRMAVQAPERERKQALQLVAMMEQMFIDMHSLDINANRADVLRALNQHTRAILQWVPDAAAALRSRSILLRNGREALQWDDASGWRIVPRGSPSTSRTGNLETSNEAHASGSGELKGLQSQLGKLRGDQSALKKASEGIQKEITRLRAQRDEQRRNITERRNKRATDEAREKQQRDEFRAKIRAGGVNIKTIFGQLTNLEATMKKNQASFEKEMKALDADLAAFEKQLSSFEENSRKNETTMNNLLDSIDALEKRADALRKQLASR